MKTKEKENENDYDAEDSDYEDVTVSDDGVKTTGLKVVKNISNRLPVIAAFIILVLGMFAITIYGFTKCFRMHLEHDAEYIKHIEHILDEYVEH